MNDLNHTANDIMNDTSNAMPSWATADAFLDKQLTTQTAAMTAADFAGKRVWIKKAAKHNPMWLYRLAGVGFWLLGLSVLKPVPSLGGQRAIATEVARLNELNDKGINVPTLLASQENGLMTLDLGTADKPARQLDTTLVDVGADECMAIFEQAVDAIFDVHQRGAWLSEAFARNIMIDGKGQMAFLDFETEPSEYLPVPHCMARDWVLFMFSVAIRLKQQDLMTQGASYLKRTIAKEPDAVRLAVKNTCTKLTFFKNLPVDKLGSDGRRLVAMSELFDWATQVE